MKFSILVPVYNVEKYLEQCVESLLNQTYNGKYEIILVDDGSTDSSGRICDKYAEDYPEKIRVIHKENEGLVSARQAGIKAATGEFSIFADSDDFVENNLLSELSLVLSEETQTEIIVFSFFYYRNNQKIRRTRTLSDEKSVYVGEKKKELYEALISTTSITSLWSKAVKTDILKNDPTDYSLYYDKNMAEDWFMSIHLLTAARKIVYINKPLYNYRTNEESISRSYKPETIEKKNILYVYERFLEYLPKWGMNTEEYHQRLNARFFNEAIYTFSKYYEKASRSEKEEILCFNWDSMVPDASKAYTNNPYENKTSRKLYTLISNKKHFQLNLYFAYKHFYKQYRKFKSRLLNK